MWVFSLNLDKELDSKNQILKLPIPIATPVYRIYEDINWDKSMTEWVMYRTYFSADMVNDFEKTVFLTEKEAKKELEKLNKKK